MLGFGLTWTWLFLQYWSTKTHMTPVPNAVVIETLLLWAMGGIIATAGMSLLLSARLGSLSRNPISLFATSVVASTGVVLNAMVGLSAVSETALPIFSAILSGAGQMLFLLMWGEVYSSAEFRSASIFIPASAFIGALLYFAIGALPSPLALAITALLPFGSALAAYRAIQPLPRMTESAPAFHRGPLIPKLYRVGVPAFAFTFGIMPRISFGSGMDFDTVNSVAIGLFTLIALVLVVASVAFSSWDATRGAYGTTLLLVVAAFLALPLLGREWMVAANAMVFAAFCYFFLLYWIMLSSLPSALSVRPLVVFARAELLSYPFALTGSLLSRSLIEALGLSSPTVTIVSLATAYLLVLATTYVLRDSRNPAKAAAASDQNQAALGDLVRERCAALGEKHDLSPRERELLQLLARGRSIPYAAEELHLSEDTVKTYSKRLYSKLGVHSRQELLNLVEACNGKEPSME